MNEDDFRKALADLPVHGLRFCAQTGSTNDDAKAWAAEGAPDGSLVYAEEQTQGRGRGKRQWYTPPGCSLAFSLIVRPGAEEEAALQLFTGLGALAVCEALEGMGLQPEVKWPNDVLLAGRKFCGILAETAWLDGKAEYVVLGMGVNITAGSVPQTEGLIFPATCLEAAAGRPIDRLALLHEIVAQFFHLRPLVASRRLLPAWERRLAFRGQMVQVGVEGGAGPTGKVDGLESDGSLRLLAPDGHPFAIQFGEVHLRPLV